MINIDHPTQITYWIIKNNDNYLRGKTMPDQVTTAGSMWSVHLVTTDEQEWKTNVLY